MLLLSPSQKSAPKSRNMELTDRNFTEASSPMQLEKAAITMVLPTRPSSHGIRNFRGILQNLQITCVLTAVTQTYREVYELEYRPSPD